MGEGVAMRHTLNRRVEDAEELGPPRGGAPGWRGVGPLSPAPWTLRRREEGLQHRHRLRVLEVALDRRHVDVPDPGVLNCAR